MRGHPIHDHANAELMQVVDKVTKIIGGTVTCRRCIVIADLITPRWAVGMLFEWQKLHMCEAGFKYILGERFRHFRITKRTVPFFNLATPRSQVNFVDRKWLAKMFAAGALLPHRTHKDQPSKTWDRPALLSRIYKAHLTEGSE